MKAIRLEGGFQKAQFKEKAPQATDDEEMKAASNVNKRYRKMMKNLAIWYRLR